MHRDLDVSAPFTAHDGRQFGLSVGAAFLLVTAVLAWRGHVVWAYGTAALGASLVLAALALPAHLGPIYRTWMSMALAISKVTTPIFMSLVYFVVLTPTGVLRRTIGRNQLRREATADGYWVTRDTARRGDLRRQF